jgi:hypothetical protein
MTADEVAVVMMELKQELGIADFWNTRSNCGESAIV